MRVWVALVALIGCGGRTSECDAEHACGFGQTCVRGACEGGGCATSQQCPMEHWCDEGACVPGCAADADCYPGDACAVETGECNAAGCRSTQLDCSFREFCDTTTGECFDAGEPYCRPCDHDEECGEGNECWNHHCGVDCTDGECPAGFACLTFVDDLGNVVAKQCLTYCWLFEEDTSEPLREGPAEPSPPRTPAASSLRVLPESRP